jgi:hypothetical protein
VTLSMSSYILLLFVLCACANALSGNSSYFGNVWDSFLPTLKRCLNIRIELKTDYYPRDNSWTLRGPSGTFRSVSFRDRDRLYSQTFCVNPGDYSFALLDSAGDGLMVAPHGYYQVFINNVLALRTTSRGAFSRRDHIFKVGHVAQMSTRDRQYLTAHNDRRRDWHARFGQPYRPLKWSRSLRNDAQNWANHLRDTTNCVLDNSHHGSSGENLASNFGGGDWGRLRTPEEVTQRWVDHQEFRESPRNIHLRQALWYASGFIGCGESHKILPDGNPCHIQVCRFIRFGNCDVGALTNLNTDPHAYVAMMSDELTRAGLCGEVCPSEGCF